MSKQKPKSKTATRPKSKPASRSIAVSRPSNATRRVATAWRAKVARRTRTPNTIAVWQNEAHVPSITLNASMSRVLRNNSRHIPVHELRRNDRADPNVVTTRTANIDNEWARSQTEYIQRLPLPDLLTVAAYTHHSHLWLGPFQRDGKLPPARLLAGLMARPVAAFALPLLPQVLRLVKRGVRMFVDGVVPSPAFVGKAPMVRKMMEYIALAGSLTPHGIRMAMEDYVTDFRRIIANAPPTRKPTMLYRGDKAVDPLPKHAGSARFTATQFTSATQIVDRAVAYTGTGAGHVTRFLLPPGTRVLLVSTLNKWSADGEAEAVLNVGTNFEIVKRGVSRWVLGVTQQKLMRVRDVRVVRTPTPNKRNTAAM